MHDIKFIRNHHKEFEKLMSRRGVEVQSSAILELDSKIRFHQTEIQVVQEKRNKISKEIGKLISQGSDISELKQTVENFKLSNYASWGESLLESKCKGSKWRRPINILEVLAQAAFAKCLHRHTHQNC